MPFCVFKELLVYLFIVSTPVVCVETKVYCLRQMLNQRREVLVICLDGSCFIPHETGLGVLHV